MLDAILGEFFSIYSTETKANAIQLNWLQSCVNWISFRFERAFHSIDQSNKNLIFRTLLKYRKRVFSEIEIGRKVLEKLGLHNSAALHAFLHRHASHDCWRLNSSYSSHCRVSFHPAGDKRWNCGIKCTCAIVLPTGFALLHKNTVDCR